MIHRRHIIILFFKRKSPYEVETFKTILPSILPDPLSRTAHGNDINVTRHSGQDVVNSDRSPCVTHIIRVRAGARERSTHLNVTKRGRR